MKMSSDIWFPVAGLFFSIMTMIILFTKGSIKTRETSIYKILIVTNFIGLLLESVREFSEDDLLSSVLIWEFNTDIY